MVSNSQKKVLFIITKGNWGGAQKHVFDLASSLSKESYDVTVAYGGKGKLQEKLEAESIKNISIDYLGRDISFFKEIKSLFAFYDIIKKTKPDIIHLHSPKAGGLGAFCARILGVKKIIYTAHGWSFNEDRGVAWKTIVFFFSWLTSILCHHVITIAEKETVQAKNFLGAKHKIIQIPLGIHPITFLEKAEAKTFIASKINEDLSQKILIGTNAELHKNKGLSYAITALSSLKKTYPNIAYVVIGEGEERKNLESLIEKLNLSDSVFLVGFVENAARYLKAFDLFLLPSVKEGLPYTLLESGAAQIPTIATNVGGIPSLITNMENGILINPKSEEEIITAIDYYLKNTEKSAELSKKLKEKVETEFSFETMLSSLLSLYNR